MEEQKPTESALITVPCNPNNWSTASQNSMIRMFVLSGLEDLCFPGCYNIQKGEYTDMSYTCPCCQCTTVFSAQAQYEKLEVRKVYICVRTELCAECFALRKGLEREVRESQRRWKEERYRMEKDLVALKRWYQALQDLPRYGSMRFYGTPEKIMLERKIATLEEASDRT